MSRKKRLIILTVIAVLLAVLLFPFVQQACKQIHMRVTEGRIVVRDGVRQNDRVYIKDAYYDAAEGKLHYTVVNSSSKNYSYSPWKFWIEKRVGDSWQIWVDDEKFKELLKKPHLEDRYFYPPYSELPGVVGIDDYWSEVAPGEYRIVINGNVEARTEGGVEDFEILEWSVSYPEKGSCIIGYFTITEEMLNP